jgi:hypothetical protein
MNTSEQIYIQYSFINKLIDTVSWRLSPSYLNSFMTFSYVTLPCDLHHDISKLYFQFSLLYIQSEHIQAAPRIWYVQRTIILLHIVYIMLLFILIHCSFNVISEWLYYSTYIKSVSQGMPRQTCIFTAPTSRRQTILIKF